MKKLPRWIKDFFNPEQFNNLDIQAIGDALNDHAVRGVWLSECLQELKRINIEVDMRLLSGNEMNLIDLCARRKAYQDMLESILTARRRVLKQELPHNPRLPVAVNLDRVTA